MNKTPRIALYSHDTMGLGHIRRTSLLARALSRPPLAATVLLISGIRESGAYPLPTGIDSLTLPAYHKQPDGHYRARHLDIPIADLTALRSRTIAAALDAYAPDLLIVDNVARGAQNELDAALAAQQARGCRLVLGLRDIIDDPVTVARQWDKLATLDTIRRYYDAVWIYGDPRYYDTAAAYRLDTLANTTITYLGYPDPLARDETAPRPPTHDNAPYALCLLGGGQDGYTLADTFARTRLPDGWRGIILSGAMMPAERRTRLAALVAKNPACTLLDFTPEPLALMRDAAAIISMAGYNTTLETLALHKRTLLVPRIVPRREQWLRASRLADMGLAACLHPDELNPDTLAAWLAADHPPLPDARDHLDYHGLDNLVRAAATHIHHKEPA